MCFVFFSLSNTTEPSNLANEGDQESHRFIEPEDHNKNEAALQN